MVEVVPRLTFDANATEVEDTKYPIEVCKKMELENVSIKKIRRRSMMSEDSPGITPPIVYILNFDVMKD